MAASQSGTCEPTGWCSFPDAGCESGSRYGELAGGGFAGQCVDSAEGTSTGSVTTSTTTTTAQTSSSSTTDQDTTDDTATPACGDGNLDPGEDCDDNNQVDGDGCTACAISGSVVWARTIIGDDGGQGHSIAHFSAGDLAVGFSISGDGESVPGVWRLDADGEIVWSWAFADGGWTSAWTWGLDVAAVADQDLIVLAVEGQAASEARGGVAMLGPDGAALWAGTVPGFIPFGAILQPDGVSYVAGVDFAFGGGLLRTFAPDGAEIDVEPGEPNSPDDGFAFDLVASGDVLYLAGQYGEPGAESAFLGLVADGFVVRHEFAPGVHNEGLAVAVDPNSSRAWVAGYALDLGGWVASITPEGIELDAVIVTDQHSANLHGIAVDPTGAAVAVGWDSAQGTRDAFVVKVAPDGTRIWSTTFATPGGDDDLRDVVVADDGSIFVVGTQLDDAGVGAGWVARLVP